MAGCAKRKGAGRVSTRNLGCTVEVHNMFPEKAEPDRKGASEVVSQIWLGSSGTTLRMNAMPTTALGLWRCALRLSKSGATESWS